ncbi:MAG TPA: hypothetical protein VGL09_03050 [Methylomirabilota bacterium]
MNASGPLHHLLRLIAGTAESEISCSECFRLLPQYAELELADPSAVVAPSPLSQHLQQCGVCREEYEVLRDLLRADAGPPPSEPT